MSGEGKVVCVTGASGFIASRLVKLLLQRGYTVKATVRDPNDPKTEFLRALDGAKERLQLFKANLLEDGSFDSAIDGCVGVFHTASPVILSVNDPQAELIDPAVKGTLNVLKSCTKFHSVKRVAVTSSIATLLYNGTPISSDVVVDETWFSNPDICKESKNWYALSKTLAEEAAWRFSKENEIDLVTIHPGFVLGPPLQPNLNFSVEVILNLINGVQVFPSPYRFVDVRDVANAHIQAFEAPTANGRYVLVGRVTQRYEVLKLLREDYPTLQLKERFEFEEEPQPQPSYQISKERAQSLGINFTPWEISLRDTIESLKEKGFLKF
ncbi:Cinnamoyl-CoA reductase 1-like [Melia azedarach]|uniref:Cinnamoyl-CoA reductase 1-like n=1 Tax=Melia azedarach TaxID=155640 RepID=A0ACC1XL42_MELAZ|nr:Cinnamoyl-CoA reductase 1-like [Melia azedarach]